MAVPSLGVSASPMLRHVAAARWLDELPRAFACASAPVPATVGGMAAVSEDFRSELRLLKSPTDARARRAQQLAYSLPAAGPPQALPTLGSADRMLAAGDCADTAADAKCDENPFSTNPFGRGGGVPRTPPGRDGGSGGFGTLTGATRAWGDAQGDQQRGLDDAFAGADARLLASIQPAQRLGGGLPRTPPPRPSAVGAAAATTPEVERSAVPQRGEAAAARAVPREGPTTKRLGSQDRALPTTTAVPARAAVRAGREAEVHSAPTPCAAGAGAPASRSHGGRTKADRGAEPSPIRTAAALAMRGLTGTPRSEA